MFRFTSRGGKLGRAGASLGTRETMRSHAGDGGKGTVNQKDGDTGDTASRRKDARRNKETLLEAAAAVFVTSGVEAPVRDIASRAGVGLGTLYRHFPTRADLIIAVYRHQVEACAEAARPSWSPPRPRTTPCGSGSTCSSTSWSPSTASRPSCAPTSRASRACTRTSSTAWSPSAPSCSTPPRQPARSARTSPPSPSCAAWATSASARRTTRTTTPAGSPQCWSTASAAPADAPRETSAARHPLPQLCRHPDRLPAYQLRQRRTDRRELPALLASKMPSN